MAAHQEAGGERLERGDGHAGDVLEAEVVATERTVAVVGHDRRRVSRLAEASRQRRAQVVADRLGLEHVAHAVVVRPPPAQERRDRAVRAGQRGVSSLQSNARRGEGDEARDDPRGARLEPIRPQAVDADHEQVRTPVVGRRLGEPLADRRAGDEERDQSHRDSDRPTHAHRDPREASPGPLARARLGERHEDERREDREPLEAQVPRLEVVEPDLETLEQTTPVEEPEAVRVGIPHGGHDDEPQLDRARERRDPHPPAERPARTLSSGVSRGGQGGRRSPPPEIHDDARRRAEDRSERGVEEEDRHEPDAEPHAVRGDEVRLALDELPHLGVERQGEVSEREGKSARRRSACHPPADPSRPPRRHPRKALDGETTCSGSWSRP